MFVSQTIFITNSSYLLKNFQVPWCVKVEGKPIKSQTMFITISSVPCFSFYKPCDITNKWNHKFVTITNLRTSQTKEITNNTNNKPGGITILNVPKHLIVQFFWQNFWGKGKHWKFFLVWLILHFTNLHFTNLFFYKPPFSQINQLSCPWQHILTKSFISQTFIFTNFHFYKLTNFSVCDNTFCQNPSFHKPLVLQMISLLTVGTGAPNRRGGS